MARFRNVETGVVVSVADEKSDRFTQGWEPADTEPSKSRRRTGAKAKAQAEAHPEAPREADSAE